MTFINTPVESSNSFLRYADEIKHDPGVKFGTNRLDKFIIPARRGEVIGIVGNSGYGKSSYMSFIAVNEARAIKSRGTGTINKDKPGEAVLYVTWEQTIETQEASTQANKRLTISDIAWGRVHQKSLVEAQKTRLQLPLWIAGRSHYSRSVNKMFVPDLFAEIVQTQTQFNITFKAIILDYLQLIPVQKGQTRVEQISQAILDTKELALNAGCPVFVGVQAKIAVLDRPDPVPGMGDTFYSSELDHVLDKGLGIFKVAKKYPIGSEYKFSTNGQAQSIPVTDELFIFNLFKQRWDTSNMRQFIHFDINKMELGDMVS